MDAKRSDEAKFKAQVMANLQSKAAYGSAWDQIAAAEKKAQSRSKRNSISTVIIRLSRI